MAKITWANEQWWGAEAPDGHPLDIMNCEEEAWHICGRHWALTENMKGKFVTPNLHSAQDAGYRICRLKVEVQDAQPSP